MLTPSTTPTPLIFSPLKIWLNSGALPPASVISKAFRMPLSKILFSLILEPRYNLVPLLPT